MGQCRMLGVSHLGFRIKGFQDGSLFRARVERGDGAPFLAGEKQVKFWETPQYPDRETAIGQAIYAIDTGKIAPSGANP